MSLPIIACWQDITDDYQEGEWDVELTEHQYRSQRRKIAALEGAVVTCYAGRSALEGILHAHWSLDNGGHVIRLKDRS